MRYILSILLSSLKPDAAALRSLLIRLGIVLTILCISAIVVALGLGFVVWSSYLYFETLYSPYVAALISGGLAILIALLLVLITLLIVGYRNGKQASTFTSAAPRSREMPDVEALIKHYPLEAGLIAAVAGFLVGSSSDTPRTLAEIALLLKDSVSE